MKLSEYDASVFKIVGLCLLAFCFVVAVIAALLGNSEDVDTFLSRPIGEQETWVILFIFFFICSIAR